MKISLKKVVGDLKIYKNQYLVMFITLSITLMAIMALLSAYSILQREKDINYMSTLPAHVTLEMDRATGKAIKIVEELPDVLAVEARASTLLRIQDVSGQWFPLRVFFIKDFKKLKLARFFPDDGSSEPETGQLLLEKTSRTLFNLPLDSQVSLNTTKGIQNFNFVGTVHDPSFAPSSQERMGYAYMRAEDLARVSEHNAMDDLKIRFQGNPTWEELERMTLEISTLLKKEGFQVREAMIPPADKHPHEAQMNAILRLFLVFGFLCLILSAILASNLISGMMRREIKNIGIMKTLGGSTNQTARLYLLSIGFIGIAAYVTALYPGIMAGKALSGAIASQLNFILYSSATSWTIYLLVLVSALIIPLGLTLFPIIKGTKISIREALQSNEVEEIALKDAKKKVKKNKFPPLLMMTLRNTFRKKGRLILSIVLLSFAGALFITARNVDSAWHRLLDESFANQRFDVDLRMAAPIEESEALKILDSLEEIKEKEGWIMVPANPYRSRELHISTTYPDGGHGLFVLKGLKPATDLFAPDLIEGNWLRDSIDNGVVLNQRAWEDFGKPEVGSVVKLKLQNRTEEFLLEGVVNEINMAAAYTNKDYLDQILNLQGKVMTLMIKFSDDSSAAQAIRQTVEEMEKNNQPIQMVMISEEFRNAITEHISIIIYSLMALGIIMAVVGTLGLASSISTAVLERKREFGILRTIGGRDRQILFMVLGEGLITGLLSYSGAFLLSLPLSYGLGWQLGNMAFKTPLSLTIAGAPLIIWGLIVFFGSLIAGLLPALQATELSIKETLQYE